MCCILLVSLFFVFIVLFVILLKEIPMKVQDKIRYSYCPKSLICIFNFILLILIIFFIVSILALILGIPNAENDLSKLISFWCKADKASFDVLLIALFSTSTLLIASYNLSKYLHEYNNRSKIEETKAIIELRKMLDEQPENVMIHRDLEFRDFVFNKKLDNPYEKTKRIEFFRYLGTIELAGIMVKKRIINIEQFYNQFGYRIDNITECEDFMSYLKSEEGKYWKDLIWIIDEISKHKANLILGK